MKKEDIIIIIISCAAAGAVLLNCATQYKTRGAGETTEGNDIMMMAVQKNSILYPSVPLLSLAAS